MCQLKDDDTNDVHERIRLLHHAASILETQQDIADPRFIANAMCVTRGAAQYARDVEKHEQRRTMLITNSNAGKLSLLVLMLLATNMSLIIECMLYYALQPYKDQ